MGKLGLQREMDSFLRETENEQFNIRRITKSGFSRSRRKLAPEAFLELNDIIWRDFYKEVDYYGYHGHKLLAVDGTYLNLPNHPSIHEEFDRRGMGRGKKKDLLKSMCLLSALYDPVNYLTLDVQTKCILIGMFIKRTIRLALAVFDKQVAANTEIVRPGRHEKRRRRPPRLYHMNYKDA
jgi:hypothetical protein